MSRRSCRDSNSQPFDHESGALPTNYPSYTHNKTYYTYGYAHTTAFSHTDTYRTKHITAYTHAHAAITVPRIMPMYSYGYADTTGCTHAHTATHMPRLIAIPIQLYIHHRLYLHGYAQKKKSVLISYKLNFAVYVPLLAGTFGRAGDRRGKSLHW